MIFVSIERMKSFNEVNSKFLYNISASDISRDIKYDSSKVANTKISKETNGF